MIIQGSKLRSWRHRKMSGTTEGVILDPRGDCLLVPPNFSIGKNKLEKGDVFRFMTEDRVALDEGTIIVEWNPELYRKGQFFTGTTSIGPRHQIPQPLYGTIEVKSGFNLKDLPWLTRLWVHL